MRCLTISQVAAELGLSRQTIRRSIASGDLPALRASPGGRWRVRESDLAETMERWALASRQELGLRDGE